MEHLRTSNNLDHGKNGMGNACGTTNRSVAGLEEKKAAVQAEISRVNQLPSNSSYAVHRMRVLKKLLHLFSIQVMMDFFLESYSVTFMLSIQAVRCVYMFSSININFDAVHPAV